MRATRGIEDLIATPERDYVPTATTIIVAPGETTATFDVPILQNDIIDVDETVHVPMTVLGTGLVDVRPIERWSSPEHI